MAETVTVLVDDLADVIDRVLTLPLAEQPHHKTTTRLIADQRVADRVRALSGDRNVREV